MCHYFLLQLPSQYKVRIDPDIFLQSITMVMDGERSNTGPWDLAPGHRLPEGMRAPWLHTVDCPDEDMVDQDQLRSVAWESWDEWAAIVATHAPSVGRKGPLKYRIPQPAKAVVANSGTQHARFFILYPHNTEPDGYEAANERTPKAPKPHKPKTPSRKKKVAAPVVETEEGESDTEKKELAGGTGGGEKCPPRVRQRRRRAPAPGAAKVSSESLDEENAAELVNDERTWRAIA
jgi:hypothetical protein